ncbi:MAG TPA: SulP family inorganic anion transporter [Polyangiaceae bacterium]|nr:SulP family inorganic anion transporter [Polyangiaceae bacterium]
MNQANRPLTGPLGHDLLAGLVVFLVALPLCLGIALASGAPMIAGLIAGIVGGLLVGFLSGSHVSVSGPAAGLTAVVVSQIHTLGSFSAFLLAVVLAGVVQIVLGLVRAGSIASFFPTSVIKGLLAAIGVILILKQIPHVVGHDPDPVGEMVFEQGDGENTFSEILAGMFDLHAGAATIGLLSVGLLLLWDKAPWLKKLALPGPLVATLFGIGANAVFALLEENGLGENWLVGPSHLVQVPVAKSASELVGFVTLPDFAAFANPALYLAAGTLAVVASLETLLNLEAVDRLDPQQRNSPPNRELLAQGVGNVVSGLLGGLPMTSVIVRGSVNINSGARTRRSAIFHGVLLTLAVLAIPTLINRIPLASLAAVLLVTGVKLASPRLFADMWKAGRSQFFPFIATVLPIVLLDLLTGVVIGLAVAVLFILESNFRTPLRRIVEHYVTGDVLRIQLANQVSFFNRAALQKTLDEVPRGGRVLLDARGTDYIDPDIQDMLREFRDKTAKAREIELSLVGFQESYALSDDIQFVDYTDHDAQRILSPEEVLTILRDGNHRFVSGQRLERDLRRQARATAAGQTPLAVVLSCIDSRTPAELIFDLGIGDAFSVRVAGNIAAPSLIGSMEYGCAVAGAKLLLVVGHTSCGAVGAAVQYFRENRKASACTGCDNLDAVVDVIQSSIDPAQLAHVHGPDDQRRFVDGVARNNVLRTIEQILAQSGTLRSMVEQGRLRVSGGLYDLTSGVVEFFDPQGLVLRPSTFVRPYSLQPNAPPAIEATVETGSSPRH